MWPADDRDAKYFTISLQGDPGYPNYAGHFETNGRRSRETGGVM